MKSFVRIAALLAAACLFCQGGRAANPYLPLWEYIPDGEPYIFEDPDNPGQLRVYIYGSHDIERSAYCGRNQVVWSAPLDDLRHWSYGGKIFESVLDAEGKPLNPDGQGDILYAPDVVEKVGPDGKKTYYLYPNNQGRGRNAMVARSDRPDGPFTVINWDPKAPNRCVGVLGFDPAVFIDDDGRVYGYWGFQQSWGAELDPETMCTVKKGTEPVRDMVSSRRQEGVFRFFEASSMRKVEDKYIFVYSRVKRMASSACPPPTAISPGPGAIIRSGPGPTVGRSSTPAPAIRMLPARHSVRPHRAATPTGACAKSADNGTSSITARPVWAGSTARRWSRRWS